MINYLEESICTLKEAGEEILLDDKPIGHKKLKKWASVGGTIYLETVPSTDGPLTSVGAVNRFLDVLAIRKAMRTQEIAISEWRGWLKKMKEWWVHSEARFSDEIDRQPRESQRGD